LAATIASYCCFAYDFERVGVVRRAQQGLRGHAGVLRVVAEHAPANHQRVLDRPGPQAKRDPPPRQPLVGQADRVPDGTTEQTTKDPVVAFHATATASPAPRARAMRKFGKYEGAATIGDRRGWRRDALTTLRTMIGPSQAEARGYCTVIV